MTEQRKISRFDIEVENGKAYLVGNPDGKYVRYADIEAAQPAPQRVAECMQFTYRHPQHGEEITVELTRDEVAEYMDEKLFHKLVKTFCDCQPVGETNVVECTCDEYADEFVLVADQPATEAAPQPDGVGDELHNAAKDFYNRTVADPEVIIRCNSAEKRDAVTESGERLRALLAKGV